MTKNKHVEHDQEKFFNQAARKENTAKLNPFLMQYVNKEQHRCFEWIADRKTILDYGCGNAESVDVFFENHNSKNYEIIGVDIAQEAINNSKKKYPQFTFYKIENNKIPRIKDATLDGAYMIHVLHHATGHQEIFNTIFSKLKPGGIFFLNDLTSNNIFIKIGRSLFTLLPGFMQERFSDDLVVDGMIPEKYKIDIPKIKNQLKKSGFTIVAVEYGHLFFFLFCWIDKFIPLSKLFFIRWIYSGLITIENQLLKMSYFQQFAEVIVIKAKKK